MKVLLEITVPLVAGKSQVVETCDINCKPVVGELIQFGKQFYEIRQVIHLPRQHPTDPALHLLGVHYGRA